MGVVDMKSGARLLVVACMLAAGHNEPAFSGDIVLPRDPWQRTDLSEHLGETYLQTFLRPVVGLDSEIDSDFQRTLTVASSTAVLQAMATFDPRVSERSFRIFKMGQDGFVQALKAIEGKSFATASLRDAVRPITDQLADTPEHQGLALSVLTTMAELASGSGTLVIIDDENYFYNVGYQDRIQSSGRSYGVSGNRKLLDATDNDYLTAITAYFGQANADPASFFKTLLDILTNTDTRGLRGMDDEGRAVITDFLTVYTAELERNNMADLSPTKWAWQTDLAEVTLIAAYGGASGLVMKDGQLVQGPANAYYESGGIGNTRAQFMRLSRLITQYMLEKHPEQVFRLTALTPLTNSDVLAAVDGDALRRFLVFLNRSETQDEAAANAAALTQAMVQYLGTVRTEHEAVTAYIRKSLAD